MPKPMFVWSGTQWLSVASEVESLANFATQSYADSQPGMKLIVPSSVTVGSGSGSVSTQGTVTFSGASSVSLNNVFSSTYDNYRILVNAINSSTSAAAITMRLRVSGTDNSSSNYRWVGSLIRDNAASPPFLAESSNGTNTFFVAAVASSTAGYYSPNSIELANPFVSTKHTGFTSQSYYYDQTATFGYNSNYGGATTVTTSYTGFTLLCSSNITGSVSVYGYKD